jgi:hypothetical protein
MRARHQKPAGIEHTHSIGLRVLPASSMIISWKSFRCPGTGRRLIGGTRADLSADLLSDLLADLLAAQWAPLSVQDVVQVTVLPRSQVLQAATH